MTFRTDVKREITWSVVKYCLWKNAEYKLGRHDKKQYSVETDRQKEITEIYKVKETQLVRMYVKKEVAYLEFESVT